MKKLTVASATFMALSSLVYAGGDMLPTVFETEAVFVPVEKYVAPVKAIPVKAPLAIEPKVNNILPIGLYVGLGLTAARFDPRCSCSPKGNVDKTAGLIGRVGYDFNQYIGVEARAIRTNWNSSGGKIKHVGIFIKPMYPVSNDINIYALGGYAKTTTEGITRRRVNAETLAWGAGLEYDLGTDAPKEGRYSRTFDGHGDQEGGWGLFADYERLVQKSGSPDLDTANVGVTYDF